MARLPVALLSACVGDPPHSVPQPSSLPVATAVDVVAASCAPDPLNATRAMCIVDLSSPAPVEIAVRSDLLAVTFRSGATRAHHEVPLWGLRADSDWDWTASASGRQRSGAVHTGTLPESVDVTAFTNGLPTGRIHQWLAPVSCGEQAGLAAVDTDGFVRWYQLFTLGDVPPPLEAFEWTEDGTALGLARLGLEEYDLLGRKVFSLETPDLPLHHDVARRDGLTWVLQAEEYVEADGLSYVEDLVSAYDSAGNVAFRWAEHDHLDATGESTVGTRTWGNVFPGALDAWHSNSIDPLGGTDFVVSLKQPSAVLGVADGEIAWALQGDGDDPHIPTSIALLGDGSASFSGQHDVRLEGDHLELFDNGDARGLDLVLDPAAGTAQLAGEWDLSGLTCLVQGSVFALDDGHRLVTCAGEHVSVEFDERASEVWRATLQCRNGAELPLTVRGQPVDLWSLSVDGVEATED